ncbi:hypothetical protein FVE85_1505 [Porphyridium purpureum]|uniref:Uncharacterized protein n=1 Tax=Porphyridium purpureum TaxID=35688 RepID=A0A5J4YWM0_PORPP|nr:hypothetical protein FVE85_1505 [Porphyridium purpureum]|eukprot:POR0477..scf209_3
MRRLRTDIRDALSRTRQALKVDRKERCLVVRQCRFRRIRIWESCSAVVTVRQDVDVSLALQQIRAPMDTEVLRRSDSTDSVIAFETSEVCETDRVSVRMSTRDPAAPAPMTRLDLRRKLKKKFGVPLVEIPQFVYQDMFSRYMDSTGSRRKKTSRRPDTEVTGPPAENTMSSVVYPFSNKTAIHRLQEQLQISDEVVQGVGESDQVSFIMKTAGQRYLTLTASHANELVIIRSFLPLTRNVPIDQLSEHIQAYRRLLDLLFCTARSDPEADTSQCDENVALRCCLRALRDYGVSESLALSKGISTSPSDFKSRRKRGRQDDSLDIRIGRKRPGTMGLASQDAGPSAHDDASTLRSTAEHASGVQVRMFRVNAKALEAMKKIAKMLELDDSASLSMNSIAELARSRIEALESFPRMLDTLLPAYASQSPAQRIMRLWKHGKQLVRVHMRLQRYTLRGAPGGVHQTDREVKKRRVSRNLDKDEDCSDSDSDAENDNSGDAESAKAKTGSAGATDHSGLPDFVYLTSLNRMPRSKIDVDGVQVVVSGIRLLRQLQALLGFFAEPELSHKRAPTYVKARSEF